MSINPKTLSSSIKDARCNLLSMYRKLNRFVFPAPLVHEVFKTNELNEDKINEIAEKFPTGTDEEENDYIYIFKVTGESTNISALKKQFVAKKAEQASKDFDGKKDMCRINAHNSIQYLYVGRSQKLRSRIRQHLGDNYKGTYALHMLRWCTNIEEKIEITCFKIEGHDNLLVQSVEDALWNKLKPCFGRKGDK